MRPEPGRGLLQRTVVPIRRAAGNSREVSGGKFVEESTQAAQTVQPDFFAESSHLIQPIQVLTGRIMNRPLAGV